MNALAVVVVAATTIASGFWSDNNAPAGPMFHAHFLADMCRVVVVLVGGFDMVVLAGMTYMRLKQCIKSLAVHNALVLLGVLSAVVTEATRLGAPPTYRLVVNTALVLAVPYAVMYLLREIRAGRWDQQMGIHR